MARLGRLVVIALLALGIAGVAHGQQTVEPGYDLWVTLPGTELDLLACAGGPIQLQGIPLSSYDFGGGPENVKDTDTIVQRLAEATAGAPTVPIQIVELQLVSVDPVDCGFGPETLEVHLNTPIGGQMTINGLGTPATGDDTFDTVLDFTYDAIGSSSGPLLTNEAVTLTSTGGTWQHPIGPGLPKIPGINFHLNGIDETEDFFPSLVEEDHAGPTGAALHRTRPTPTLGQWGVIVFGGMLAAAGGRFVARRRRVLDANE